MPTAARRDSAVVLEELVQRAQNEGQMSLAQLRTTFEQAGIGPDEAGAVLRRLTEAGVVIGSEGDLTTPAKARRASSTRMSTRESTRPGTARKAAPRPAGRTSSTTPSDTHAEDSATTETVTPVTAPVTAKKTRKTTAAKAESDEFTRGWGIVRHLVQLDYLPLISTHMGQT